MSHEFESGFFSREPAWHNLGKVLDKVPNSEEAIKLAGLDWLVEKKSMYLQDGSLIPEAFAMVRDKDNKVLGTVGKRYTALQNKEAFDFFDPIINDGLAEYETAGSLMGGKRVWVLAKLTNDIELSKDDVVKKYVLLSSTHDGSGTVMAKVTGVRVVCWNTLSASLREETRKGDEIKIRHTKTVKSRTEQAAKLLTTVNETYDKLASVWKEMMSFDMTPIHIMNYTQSVLPDPEGVDNPYKTQKQRAEVLQLMGDSSIGGQLDGSVNTLWGCYNSVTAFADHMISTRKDASPEKHLESMWFGNRAKLKDKAFQTAISFMKDAGVSLDI